MTTVDHQGVSPLCARLSQRREGADVTFHALLARSVRAGLRDSALLSRVGARESSVQRLFSRNGGEGSFSSAGSYNGARRPSGSGFSWITMPPTEVEAPEQAVRQRRSWWSAPKQGSRSTIQRVASRAGYRSTTARSIVPSVVRPSVGSPRFVGSIDESTPAVQTPSYSQDFSPEIAVASRMVQSSATSDYLNPSAVRVAASRAEVGRVTKSRRSQLPTVVPAVLASPVSPEVAASSFDTEVAHAPSVASVVSPAPSPVRVAASRAEIGRAVAGRRSQLPTVTPAVLASPVTREVVSDAVENMGVRTRSLDGTVVSGSIEVAASRTPALRAPAPSPVSVAASRTEIGRAVPGRRSQLPTVVPAVLASPVAPEVAASSFDTEEAHAPSVASVVSSVPSPVSVAASRAEIGRSVPGRRSQLPTVVPAVLASPVTPEVVSDAVENMGVRTRSSDGTVVPSSIEVAASGAASGMPALRAPAPSPVSVAASRAEIGRSVPGRRSQLPTVVPAVLASPVAASSFDTEVAHVPSVASVVAPAPSPVSVAASRAEIGRAVPGRRSQLPTVIPAVLASPVTPEVVSDAVENMGVRTRSSDGTVVSSSVEVAASGTPALRAPAPSPVSVAASRAEIGRAVPGRRSQLPTVVPAVLASPVAPEVVSDSVGNLEVRRRPLDGTEGSRLIEVVAGGTPSPRESAPSLVNAAASRSTEATPVMLPAPRESAPSPVSVATSRAEIGRAVPGRRSQLPTVVPTVLASPATPEVSSETPRSGWVEATSFGTRAVRASAPSPVSVAASRAEIGRAVPGRRSQLPTVVPAVLASSREDNIRFPGRAPVAHALSREHLGLQSETGNSMLPVVTPRFGFLDSANAPSVESSVPARTRRSGWAQPIAGKEPKTAAVQSVQRRRTQAQRSIQTELVRATTTEAVAKLASERGEAMNRLANDLPSPTRRLVRKLVKAGVKAASAQRKQSRSKSSSSWAPAHLNRSASGASMDGTDGIGSSGVMKLASKLQGLIHLAEVQNRRSEAQQAVRMAEEAAAAETLGSAAEATSSGATSTIDDLRRDVLDAVMADLERLQMRSEEDPDGVELWW